MAGVKSIIVRASIRFPFPIYLRLNKCTVESTTSGEMLSRSSIPARFFACLLSVLEILLVANRSHRSAASRTGPSSSEPFSSPCSMSCFALVMRTCDCTMQSRSIASTKLSFGLANGSLMACSFARTLRYPQ